MKVRFLPLPLLLLALWAPPAAAGTVPLSENGSIVERGSNPWRTYGIPGDSLVLNAGELRGVRDIQGGYWDPAVPSLVHLDIGAGNPNTPGWVNCGADVSLGCRLQNGLHRTVLGTRDYGVAVAGQLTVDRMNVSWRIRRLEARVRLLQRRMKKILR